MDGQTDIPALRNPYTKKKTNKNKRRIKQARFIFNNS